jgi:hypothetical protein
VEIELGVEMTDFITQTGIESTFLCTNYLKWTSVLILEFKQNGKRHTGTKSAEGYHKDGRKGF